MKLFISTLALTLSLNALACNLTLTKKSATSKAAYIGTQSISAKVQAALKSVCKLDYRMMTLEELIQFEQVKTQNKIERLKKAAKLAE